MKCKFKKFSISFCHTKNHICNLVSSHLLRLDFNYIANPLKIFSPCCGMDTSNTMVASRPREPDMFLITVIFIKTGCGFTCTASVQTRNIFYKSEKSYDRDIPNIPNIWSSKNKIIYHLQNLQEKCLYIVLAKGNTNKT